MLRFRSAQLIVRVAVQSRASLAVSCSPLHRAQQFPTAFVHGLSIRRFGWFSSAPAAAAAPASATSAAVAAAPISAITAAAPAGNVSEIAASVASEAASSSVAAAAPVNVATIAISGKPFSAAAASH
jgi:hypothetical protein